MTLSPPTFPGLRPVPSVNRPSQPVFVDGTGRRGRVLRWAVIGLAGTCTAYLAILGVALGAGSVDPATSGLPLSGVVAPLIAADPEATSSGTPRATSSATAVRPPTSTAPSTAGLPAAVQTSAPLAAAAVANPPTTPPPAPSAATTTAASPAEPSTSAGSAPTTSAVGTPTSAATATDSATTATAPAATATVTPDGAG